MMESATTTPHTEVNVVEDTPYRSHGGKTSLRSCGGCLGCLGGCLGGCFLCAITVGMTVIAIILAIYGIVLGCKGYSDIPDCAHAYKAWLIVIIIFLSFAFQGTYHNAKKKDDEDIPSLGSHLCMAIFICLVPLLGYFMVVRKTDDDNCNLQPMEKIHNWTLYTIYYFTALTVVVLCRGVLVACAGGASH